MNKFLTNEWLCDYLSCLTGQEIVFSKEYEYTEVDPQTNEKETGVMKVFSSEDYAFSIYFLNNEVYLREHGKRVRVHSFRDLDRIIESQIQEHFQV